MLQLLHFNIEFTLEGLHISDATTMINTNYFSRKLSTDR